MIESALSRDVAHCCRPRSAPPHIIAKDCVSISGTGQGFDPWPHSLTLPFWGSQVGHVPASARGVLSRLSGILAVALQTLITPPQGFEISSHARPASPIPPPRNSSIHHHLVVSAKQPWVTKMFGTLVLESLERALANGLSPFPLNLPFPLPQLDLGANCAAAFAHTSKV